MKLLRRSKLLVASGALTLAGLAATALPAHALVFWPPHTQVSLSPTSLTCPTLTVAGGGYYRNANILVTLRWNGTGGAGGALAQLVTTDSNGSLPPVTFTNPTTQFEDWQAEADEQMGSYNWRTFSNKVTCAP
jgi:hypothetical protein